ncbi:MAG TPA: C39 family peptidase [Chthoniobacteraceae bacterium]|nr:C39 family peptidase [Chthoniobacteraceae bacterium]
MKLRTLILVILTAVAALLLLTVLVPVANWTQKKVIPPSGGRYFFHRVELPVPQLFQADEKWADDPLAATKDTLGGEGCAITSIAMIFQYYGIDTDPQRMNWFLDTNGGYTPEGWVYWEKAALIAPDRVKHIYEDLPSYYLIDSNLARGNPVIVKLKLRSGVTHFVVIAGKEGWDYLIRDPATGGEKGIYPLKDLGSDILGLRYYEAIAKK